MAYVYDRTRTRSKTGAAIWSNWRTTRLCRMPIRPEYGLVGDLWLWFDCQLDPISVCQMPARSDHTLYVTSYTKSYFVGHKLTYHTFVCTQLD